VSSASDSPSVLIEGPEFNQAVVKMASPASRWDKYDENEIFGLIIGFCCNWFCIRRSLDSFLLSIDCVV